MQSSDLLEFAIVTITFERHFDASTLFPSWQLLENHRVRVPAAASLLSPRAVDEQEQQSGASGRNESGVLAVVCLRCHYLCNREHRVRIQVI